MDDIPLDVVWTPWSQSELAGAPIPPQEIVRLSNQVWGMRDGSGNLLLLAGVFKPSLIGTMAELWLLIAEDFNMYRHAREVRNLFKCAQEIYPVLQVKVKEQFLTGLKFAKHFGFREVGDMTVDNQRFVVLECHLEH